MPDAKISDLPAGGDPQDTDEFVVARGATNVSLAWSSLSNAATRNNVALTLDGNTAGVLALISSGTLTLAGGNNITVSQVGNAITLSGANVGGAQTGISGIANSETTYTSGTVSLSELGAITIRSTTGNQFQLSVNPQSVQPETQTFIGGISASDTLYTSGTVRITGVGGGITVSTNTGQRIDLSVAAQSVQPETQTFVGGIANSQTTYTSGTVSLSELGAVTIRSTTGNQFQISVNSQSVQPETQTFIAGISASDTLYTSGNVRFTGVGGGVTVSSNTGQRVDISVAAQSVQPETQTFIGGIANSQTTYTSGTVSLSELGAITIRSTTGNQYQLSVNSQTVQTQGVLSAGVSTGGNTAGNTTVNTGSRFVIVGSNGITASQGTAAGATTVTLSGITQSVQTNDIPRLGVSTGGNTSGDTTVNSGTRFVLVGSNGITLSQGTAASATTVTISGITQSVQTQGILNVALSNIGNTSGDTGINSGTRMVLAGGNNITLSASTAANATTITISAPNLGAGAMSAGVSNLGNTAGSTGITGTQLVLVGSGVMSLSQSTGANGGTVSINAPATSSLSGTGLVSLSTNGSTISIGVPGYTASIFRPWKGEERLATQHGQATLHMQPYPIPLPVQWDRAVVPVQYSQATNSTLTVTMSAWFGLYTRNASTLSLLHSGSNTFSINGSGTASSNQNSGPKNMTFGWTTTVQPQDYWLAFISRTTTAGNNASISVFGNTQQNSAWSGMMGVAVGASAQYVLGLGTYSATTSAVPASVGFDQLTGSGAAVQRQPLIWFISETV